VKEAIRSQILEFVENPSGFSQSGAEASRELWLGGIDTLELQRPLLAAQRLAWEGISHHRLALLLGPPGTGKTFALSAMAMGYLLRSAQQKVPCRIFVTAFTRNAICNLLSAITARCPQKLRPDAPIAFIGNQQTKPDSGDFDFFDRKTDSEALEQFLGRDQCVVGATIWTLQRLLLAPSSPLEQTTFDLILLDEASQLPVSHGLMALSAITPTTRVVVAGDDRQLPPIRAPLAEDSDPRRLSSSLYDFLKASGIAEFALEETFRLNQVLTEFPERKFYPGKYRPTSDVSAARLALRPTWQENLPKWVQVALDPDHPICVLLHDGLPAGTHNDFEVSVVSQLVRAFYEAVRPSEGPVSNQEFWNERLAVISPHRAQNAAIRKSLSGHPCADDAVVETVERIQGRERDAIIVSYTVSDAEFAQTEGAFLFSPQRLNVMITRAKTKLIAIVSRRLLEVVPSNDEVLEAAQHLREFAYDTVEVGRANLEAGLTSPVEVSIRVKTFGPAPSPIEFPEPEVPQALGLPDYTPELDEMFRVIQKIAQASQYGSARSSDIKNALLLGQSPTLKDLYPLIALGKITVESRKSDRGEFWVAKPVDPPRVPYAATEESVRLRIEEVIRAIRKGKWPPFYSQIRNRFLWLDDQGNDQLRPVLEKLADDGLVTLRREKDTVDLAQSNAPRELSPLPPPDEALKDADFEVLNALEDLEVRRINFGITESWPRVKDLSQTLDRAQATVLESIVRLRTHGYLIHEEEGRIRSRMAELAREIRYVKQRFAPGDKDRRPFLVRSLKIEVIQRQKPSRTHPLSQTLASIGSSLNDSQVEIVLKAIQATLAQRWNVQDPLMAGFQCRSFSAILKAWLDEEPSPSFVITADTGSGKTEAACLPMIAGTAVDLLKGLVGTRAILVYPRIRLAANQAQRIVGYLAAFNQQPGVRPISLGLQNGAVPHDLRSVTVSDNGEWSAGPGGLCFPFFGCPQAQCGNDLVLQIRGGHQSTHDRLYCPECKWYYDAWIGDKLGLRKNPPNFFLPVTESLHQWQQDSQYGALFGDSSQWAAARAVLADEIHLYSHIHGAQVGLTLRRLLARLQINHPRRIAPVAIGMSATLGNPQSVWGELIGRESVMPLAVEKHERQPSVRGREYFYFIQPEVESRGKDIAGAATTIQSLMCLAHGIRRRTGAEGGYRTVVFLDSIDKVKRLHGDFLDAEESKGLAQFRTYLYDDDPGTGNPRRECCGEPLCCDRFQAGECWFFAARDQAQWTARGRYQINQSLSVCSMPIYSGTKGRVEKMIKASDIVFATSTLEVGYDDPDITMVYQHYAPQNLASFVQRKGRGGRGADDRPVTGVTLSVYSPRDSFYFRRPSQMLDAAHFRVPLNVSNFFVLRGQIASALLDIIARMRAQNQGSGLGADRALPSSTEAIGLEFLHLAFGSDVLGKIDCSSLAELWNGLVQEASASLDLTREPRDWALHLPSVPERLFDSINLPRITVEYADEKDQWQASCNEDISQVFYLCAPGNITRRYGFQKLHWLAPTDGKSMFLPSECYKDSQGFSLFDNDDDGKILLQQVPLLIRAQLSGGLYPKICQPARIRFADAGKLHGAGWTGLWQYDPATKVVEKAQLSNSSNSTKVEVGPKSRSSLRGFVVVIADSALAESNPASLLSRFVDHMEVFQGGKQRANTGLKVAKVYWGADIQLQLEDLKLREATLTQTFCYPKSDKILLHGYQVETEGIRLHLRSDVLDAFVKTELDRLSTNDALNRTLRGRFLAYLSETSLTSRGFNSYEANRLSELLVSAASQPEGRASLGKLTRRWDSQTLMALLKKTFQECLCWHPLLSERRVEKLSSLVEPADFREVFSQLMADVSNDELFHHYIRSLILHGLCHRLRDIFVLRGYGDERKVICHAKLPIQFGSDAEDIITVAENGNHGDGTTRAFLENFELAAEEWLEAGLVDCPNAAEDRLLEAIFEREERHPYWRSRDPKDPDQMKALVDELKLPLGLTGIGLTGIGLTRIIQILYGGEAIGPENFEFYDLYREIRQVNSLLRKEYQRDLMSWETVSAVVTRASAGEDSTTPRLSALLRAYQSVEDASDEGSMSPEARLADQVYRLSGKLCVDGCEACLYGDSHLMSNSAARNLLSRNMLERFSAFIRGESS